MAQREQHRETHLELLLPVLGRTALLAAVCNLALEVTQATAVDGVPWKYKTPTFVLLFLLGTLVIWAVVMLVHAVTGRFWVTALVTATLTVLMAGADFQKVRLRREPLYPSDWHFAGQFRFLQEMLGGRTVLLMAAAMVAGLILAGSLVRRQVRRRRSEGPRPRRVPLRVEVPARLGAAVLALLFVSQLAQFNEPRNPVRVTYEALGADWMPWSQQRNYLRNGYVGGVLYNLDVPTMPAPAGYSAGQMQRIVERYARAAEHINDSRHHGALDDVNVVMVLSETFSDPTALRGVRLREDPIPSVRRLMSETMSGRMLSPNIGGGTANIEFEALSGMSLAVFPPQTRVPYQMVVPQYDTFPSVVEYLKQTGHRAVAIHPYTTEMYRRKEVYRSFGFDEFVYDETMHEQERLGNDGFISDASAYDEVLWQLENTDQPLFLNLVTMQNHIPFPGRYDDPVTVLGPDGAPMEDIGHYVRGLTYTDQATEDFFEELGRLDEETVVVFYGDHLPGVYPDTVLERNNPLVLRQTPFLVWSKSGQGADPQPVTSPTHFMDLVLEHAGATVPPYYALLHELRQEIPAMANGKLLDPSGRVLEEDELTGRAARLLADYRMVQYDLSAGRRYSEAAMLGATSGDESLRAATR